eukprot:m51a1_g6458 hypothetical protein (303) ;mRNA; r:17679-18775
MAEPELGSRVSGQKLSCGVIKENCPMNGLLEGRGRQVREAEEKARASQAHFDDIAKKYQALQGEYQKQSEALLELAEERSALVRQSKMAGKKSKDKSARPSDFDKAMDQLKVLQTQMTQVLGENAEIKAENAEIKAQCTKILAENAEIKAKNAEIKAQCTKILAENAEIKAQYTKVSEEVASLKSRLRCLLTRGVVEVLKQGSSTQLRESSTYKWVYETTTDPGSHFDVVDMWRLPEDLELAGLSNEGHGVAHPNFTVAELMIEKSLVADTELTAYQTLISVVEDLKAKGTVVKSFLCVKRA